MRKVLKATLIVMTICCLTACTKQNDEMATAEGKAAQENLIEEKHKTANSNNINKETTTQEETNLSNEDTTEVSQENGEQTFLEKMCSLESYKSDISRSKEKNSVIVEYNGLQLILNSNTPVEEVDTFFNEAFGNGEYTREAVSDYDSWTYRQIYHDESEDKDKCSWRIMANKLKNGMESIYLGVWVETLDTYDSASIDGITIDSTIDDIIDTYGVPNIIEDLEYDGYQHIVYYWNWPDASGTNVIDTIVMEGDNGEPYLQIYNIKWTFSDYTEE